MVSFLACFWKHACWQLSTQMWKYLCIFSFVALAPPRLILLLSSLCACIIALPPSPPPTPHISLSLKCSAENSSINWEGKSLWKTEKKEKKSGESLESENNADLRNTHENAHFPLCMLFSCTFSSARNFVSRHIVKKTALLTRKICERENYSTMSSGSTPKKCCHGATKMEEKLLMEEPLGFPEPRADLVCRPLLLQPLEAKGLRGCGVWDALRCIQSCSRHLFLFLFPWWDTNAQRLCQFYCSEMGFAAALRHGWGQMG